MRFSTKCWSEHILSAYKATKDLKDPLYMTFKYSYNINKANQTYLHPPSTLHFEGKCHLSETLIEASLISTMFLIFVNRESLKNVNDD